MTRAKDISKIVSDANLGGTLDVVGVLTGTSLDISGDVDVDGTTNLDVVDIDGAVDFASTTAHAGNATFADNAKAIFGAGSDLQIYHNGSNSYIHDGGTGNLYIRGSDSVRLQAATGEQGVIVTTDGAVTLYHDNGAKLATTSTGIDVTGTVTSTGTSVFASLDISGDIDVNGTTNLDVVDIDGAVDMASTALVTGVLTTTAATVFNGGFASNANSSFTSSLTHAANAGVARFNNSSTGQPVAIYLEAIADNGGAGNKGAIYFDAGADGSVANNSLSFNADHQSNVTPDMTITPSGVSITGTLGVTGAVTANAGVVVDNITIDGTTIALSSGDLTLDVSGDIILDADGGDIFLKDGGTQFGVLSNDSGYFDIKSTVSNQDISFKGNDGGATITALRLDMSDAGRAVFNAGLSIGGTGTANTLDDYEEGIVTAAAPPSGAGTITLDATNNHLAYTKVGRMVTITGALVVDAVSSPAGAYVTVTGLPFAVGDVDGLAERGAPSITFFDQSAGTYNVTPSIYIANATSFRIYRAANTWTAADSVYVNFSYFTA